MAMDDVMPKGEDTRRGLLAAEKAGRGGDRVIGHLTPGELVVPKSCQTPEVMEAFAKAAHVAGLDPNRFIVGSPEASKNPKTGLEEFLEGDSGGVGDTGSGNSSSGSSGGSNSNGAGPMGGENAAHGENQSSTADRDAAYGGEWGGDGGGGFGGWVSDKFNSMFAAPSEKSLGIMGTGIGMIGGPVGVAMSVGPAVAETMGNAITSGIQDAFGVTASSPPGTVSHDYGNGVGGGSNTSSRVGELDPATQRARRRGLLPSART